ncbi:MAG: PPC domain-containing DNA-binding protein [Candidatus Neomarinimicrobiota bacterium]
MQYRKAGDRYFVYIRKNEPVLETLTEFCIAHNIDNGQLSGIGALKDIEIGAFDPDTKQYTRKLYAGNYELIACQGNITLLDGKPFIHAHVSLGDHGFNLVGGHLFAGQVAVVGEFIIIPLAGDAHREFDPEIGLSTWHF